VTGEGSRSPGASIYGRTDANGSFGFTFTAGYQPPPTLTVRASFGYDRNGQYEVGVAHPTCKATYTHT
jgi:hypothetical protein